MPAFSCDPRTFYGRSVSFSPTGRTVRVSDAGPPGSNPYGYRIGANQLAARLFINLRHDLPTLIHAVRGARAKQKPMPHTSFIVQLGIYTTSTTRRTVSDTGAQVLLFGAARVSLPTFKKQIEAIGEAVARELKLKLVVIEIQRSGLQIITCQATP